MKDRESSVPQRIFDSMNNSWVSQFSDLTLGIPEGTVAAKRNRTHFFIRLICPPFCFNATDLTTLVQKAQNESCAWEIVEGIANDDSFLGNIPGKDYFPSITVDGIQE